MSVGLESDTVFQDLVATHTDRILGCQEQGGLQRPIRLTSFIYTQGTPRRGEAFAQDGTVFGGTRPTSILDLPDFSPLPSSVPLTPCPANSHSLIVCNTN